MRIKLLFSLLLGFTLINLNAQNNTEKLDKGKFYKIFSLEDIEKINSEIDNLKELQQKDKDGYEGALLMKKAGLISGLNEKLSLFKAGHKKLEAAIMRDTSSVEFRFLRLAIQENCPRILGYHNEIKKDSAYISKFYKNQPAIVQDAILNYSKQSKVLKLGPN